MDGANTIHTISTSGHCPGMVVHVCVLRDCSGGEGIGEDNVIPKVHYCVWRGSMNGRNSQGRRQWVGVCRVDKRFVIYILPG